MKQTSNPHIQMEIQYLHCVDLVPKAIGVLAYWFLLGQTPLNLTDFVHHIHNGSITKPILLNHGLLQDTQTKAC